MLRYEQQYLVFSFSWNKRKWWAVAASRGESISGLQLPFLTYELAVSWGESRLPGSVKSSTRVLKNLQEAVNLYFRGQEFDPTQFPVDWSMYSDFQKMVYSAVQRVPYGKCISYGELAELIGCPRGARAVGQALRRNQHLLLIPCHRVVGANGSLGGFSAPGGRPIKKALLQLEGREK